MIRTLSQLVRRRVSAGDPEAGMGLAEVLVAMFVFALVSVGLLHTLTQSMTTTRDSRARQVAANLAASEVDRAREEADLFSLLPVTRPAQTVGTDTFHVVRTTAWVTDPSSTFDCGAGGGGTLRYKRVNVEVRWDNMDPSTEPVRADTLIEPKEKINDPSRGTILVSVVDANGNGVPGVAVTATPAFGAGVAPAPTTTDSQGCAYLLKVVPGGDYTVSVSKSGHVDPSQKPTSTLVVGVAAGKAASAGFQYDTAATFTASYAVNTTEPGVRRPTDMLTSFVSSHGTYTAAGTVSGANRTFALHPFPSGYSAFAGTCAAADPAAWPATTTAPVRVGLRQPAVAAAPGGSVAAPVNMGIVKISGLSGTRSLKAVSAQNTLVGDPGCASQQTLMFGDAVTSGRATIALPYGTWQLYHGASGASNPSTLVTTLQLTPVTTAPGTTTVGLLGAVTFDPRVVAP